MHNIHVCICVYMFLTSLDHGPPFLKLIIRMKMNLQKIQNISTSKDLHYTVAHNMVTSAHMIVLKLIKTLVNYYPPNEPMISTVLWKV